LCLFLRGYAFEHQGRSQDFGPAAADSISQIRRERLDPGAAHEAWEVFSKTKLPGRDLNCAVNPLCPQGTDYKRGETGLLTRKLSAIEFAVSIPHNRTLVSWAAERIRAGETKEAHVALCKINGIGPKISSLFLRDVAVALDLSVPQTGRELLQPVDVWVRLVARKLAGKEGFSDAECAGYLVANADQPEQLNQGLWYFCARIAESSRYLVSSALTDQAAMENLVHDHLSLLRKGKSAADEFQGVAP
jgi:hypothetical protein